MSIKEERMKSYFIQATKDIIKGEGLKAISVRNIAERAGYSYATLYNYFSHLNELIFHCVNDFQEEIRDKVARSSKKSEDPKVYLRNSLVAYSLYFIEYPGIFELFYLTGSDAIGHKKSTSDLIENSIEDATEVQLINYYNSKNISEEEFEILKKEIRYSLIGLLLFYLNWKSPKSFKSFKQELEQVINNSIK